MSDRSSHPAIVNVALDPNAMRDHGHRPRHATVRGQATHYDPAE